MVQPLSSNFVNYFVSSVAQADGMKLLKRVGIVTFPNTTNMDFVYFLWYTASTEDFFAEVYDRGSHNVPVVLKKI